MQILEVEEMVGPWLQLIEPFIPFLKRADIWLSFCKTLNEIQKDDGQVIPEEVEKLFEKTWFPLIQPYVPRKERDALWIYFWHLLKSDVKKSKIQCPT